LKLKVKEFYRRVLSNITHQGGAQHAV